MLDDHLALDLWEQAAHLAPVDRAVRTLAAIRNIDPDSAADWPVDERDLALIEARCDTFGPTVEFYVACPECSEPLETEFDLRRLLAEARDAPLPRGAASGGGPALRAPTSREVARAARDSDPAGLILACLAGPGEPGERPDLARVEAALEQAFPLLNVAIDFTCPACEADFSRRFDAAAYLWADIERLSETLVADVHRLASAYGWSEREILGMSRRRREAYLARIAA
jgi:hypothetical protein